MKVDGNIGTDLRSVAKNAQEVEAAGYSGAWTAETSHDPFLPLLLAAEHTETTRDRHVDRRGVRPQPDDARQHGVGPAGVFAGPLHPGPREPDQAAHHQAVLDGVEPSGRRMREMVLAMRAIWNTWLTGEKLDFRGDFYTHTLMTPFFTPSAAELEGFGPPKVFLAGVGELMTEVAGEVCDGFLCHGFTTEKYLREVTIPALERGRAKAGKTLEGFEIVGPSFVVTGNDDAELEAAAAGTRQQIAFYGSTPAYRNVLEIHGWGGLQDEFNALSKQGEWVEMGG
jgi:alkanesulfonate monooxygenase SsuD/methylene tetrahydromethanopterin reductase-like flavin-dependent oxidoreductase (luciferase family)